MKAGFPSGRWVAVVILAGVVAVGMWVLSGREQPHPLRIVSLESGLSGSPEYRLLLANAAQRQQEILVCPEAWAATGWVSRTDLQRQFRMLGTGTISCRVLMPDGATVWRLRIDNFEWRAHPLGLLARIGSWFGFGPAYVRSPIFSEPITNTPGPPDTGWGPAPVAAGRDAPERR